MRSIDRSPVESADQSQSTTLMPVEPALRNWLKMLGAPRKRKRTTVRDFFRHLAGLGGFLLRKRDGNPGWITLWRGPDKLLLAIRGYTAMNQRCG